MEKLETILKDFSKNLSHIFRNILPGMLIIGLAYLSNAPWFSWVDLNSKISLFLLFIISLTIGNTWYVLNRYILQQMIDFVIITVFSKLKFRDWLTDELITRCFEDTKYQKIRDDLFFKTAHIFYLQIFSEALYLFTCIRDNNSTLNVYANYLYILSILAYIMSLFQVYFVFYTSRKVTSRTSI